MCGIIIIIIIIIAIIFGHCVVMVVVVVRTVPVHALEEGATKEGRRGRTGRREK